MKLINKSKLLAAVCIADLLLLGGLIHTVRGEMPAHVSADEGSWVREGIPWTGPRDWKGNVWL